MEALLVVDMQVGNFNGEPPRRDQDGTVRRINALSRAIRPGGAVIFIQHTVAEDGYPKGSREWQLLPNLDVQPADLLAEKTACDSFLETPLDDILKAHGISEVIIVGCATDFCVDTTVRSATAHGYKVTVPHDAHTTRDRAHLSADAIIKHHNYMWAELLLPRGQKVRLIGTDALLEERNRLGSGPNGSC